MNDRITARRNGLRRQSIGRGNRTEFKMVIVQVDRCTRGIVELDELVGSIGLGRSRINEEFR